MSTAALRGVVRGLVLDGPATDAALVTRYARLNDHGAFAELLRRHGPVVLGVCRRTLGRDDADDAFQAVFLVLARKAGCVRPPGSVGGWLYGVAVRVSKKAKVAAARRWRREMNAQASPGCQPGGSSDHPGIYTPGSPEHVELRAVIDAELGRLPDKLRLPVVLCDLGGKTRSEAARELGLPDGTVAARLHQARKLLAVRLGRRGVALPAAGLAVLAGAEPVSADLARATLTAAGAFAKGSASPVVSTTAQSLAEGVVRAMNAGTWKVGLGAVLAAGLLAGGGWMWAANGPPATHGKGKGGAPAKAEAAVTTDAPGYVADVSFSPDGLRYAVVAGGKVTVHDAASGKVLWTAAGEALRFVAGPKGTGPAGPDGKPTELPPVQQYAAVLGNDGYVYRRAATGEIVFSLGEVKADGFVVRFSPDGEGYAVHVGNAVRAYRKAGSEEVPLNDLHTPGAAGHPPAPPGGVFFSRDGRYVVGVGVLVEPGNVGVGLWRVDTGERLFAVGGEKGLTAAAPGTDREALAIGYTDRIDLWPPIPVADPKDGTVDRGPRRSPKQVKPAGVVTALAYSPDGKLVAAGIRRDVSEPAVPTDQGPGKEKLVVPHVVKGHATEVQLFDAATGKELRRFAGFGKLPVTALAFSPDGKQLAAGTGVHPAISEPATENPKAGEVKVFALAPEAAPPEEPKADERPAIVERNQDLWVWQERPRPEGAGGPVHSVAFAPDGQAFAAGTAGGSTFAWDAATRKELWAAHDEHPGPVGVAYSPDGRTLAATTRRVVQRRDAATGRPNAALLGAGDEAVPSAVAFGPTEEQRVVVGRVAAVRKVHRLAFTDGRTLWAKTWVDGGEPGTAQFGPLADAPKVDKPHAGVAYSPDGKRLVFIPNSKIDPTWPGNGAARPDPAKATHWYAQVWGGGSGEPMHMLAHGPNPVTAVAWAPDGRIATADDKGMVVIWDGATYQMRKRVQVSGPVTALAVRSDGKRFVVGVRVPPAGDGDKGITQVEVFTEQEGSNPDNWMTSSTLGLQPDELVKSVAFSPDGLVMIAGTATADGEGGGLRVWDRVKLAPKDGEGQEPAAAPPPPAKPADPPAAAAPAPPAGPWREGAAVPGVTAPVDGVAFDPAGKVFVVAAGGAVSARDPATLRERWAAPLKATAVAFTPDFRRLLVARPGGATVLDTDTGKAVGEFAAGGVSATGETKPRALGTDPPPAAVAGGAYVNVQGTDFYRLALSDGWATWAEAVLDGGVPKQYVITPADATPKPAGRLPAGVAYDPTGERLVAISNTKLDPAWPENGEPKQDPAKATHWCAQVCRPDGGGVTYLKHGTSRVTAVGWSPDGRWVVTAGDDGNVSFWKAGVGEFGPTPVRTVNVGGRGRTTPIRAVAFSPDGKTLAVAADPADPKFPARVAVVDVATGAKAQELRGFTDAPPSSLAFSPDGKMLVVGCRREGVTPRGEVKVFTTAPAR